MPRPLRIEYRHNLRIAARGRSPFRAGRPRFHEGKPAILPRNALLHTRTPPSPQGIASRVTGYWVGMPVRFRATVMVPSRALPFARVVRSQRGRRHLRVSGADGLQLGMAPSSAPGGLLVIRTHGGQHSSRRGAVNLLNGRRLRRDADRICAWGVRPKRTFSRAGSERPARR